MTESSLRAQKLPVLEVEDLAVSLPPGGDRPNAVEHVSFTVNEGEVTCLIGESGSGKSVIASTVMGLLPKGLAPAEGSVKLLGMDLFRRTPDEIRRLRGLLSLRLSFAIAGAGVMQQKSSRSSRLFLGWRRH